MNTVISIFSVVFNDQLKVHFCLKLRYRLQQKQECLSTTKDQLRDVKEQHQGEVQKRERLEFSLRRVEEETMKLVNQVDDLNVRSMFVRLLSVCALIYITFPPSINGNAATCTTLQVKSILLGRSCRSCLTTVSGNSKNWRRKTV